MQRSALTNSDSFENRIKMLLKPVSPDPTFVTGLSHRLSEKAPIRIESLNSLAIMPVLIAAGLVSGAILLWFLNNKREVKQTRD